MKLNTDEIALFILDNAVIRGGEVDIRRLFKRVLVEFLPESMEFFLSAIFFDIFEDIIQGNIGIDWRTEAKSCDDCSEYRDYYEPYFIWNKNDGHPAERVKNLLEDIKKEIDEKDQ